MTGAYVVGLALVLALGFGLYRRTVDGSLRTRPGAPVPVLAESIGGELGETATFVQFSSPACAPCRATSRVLAEVGAGAGGVAHIEIDAEQRLDLVEKLGITRTPTVLLLDRHGVERGRIVGAARTQDVWAALDDLGAAETIPGGSGASSRSARKEPR